MGANELGRGVESEITKAKFSIRPQNHQEVQFAKVQLIWALSQCIGSPWRAHFQIKCDWNFIFKLIKFVHWWKLNKILEDLMTQSIWVLTKSIGRELWFWILFCTISIDFVLGLLT